MGERSLGVNNRHTGSWSNKAYFLVMAVIIGIFLILIIYHSCDDMLCGPDEPPVEYRFNPPEVEMRTIEGTDYYDVVAVPRRSYDRIVKVLWSELRIEIVSKDGDLLLPGALSRPDDPTSYDNGTDGHVDIEVWYESDHTYMTNTPNCWIKVTGLQHEHEGAKVRLLKAGGVIGAFKVPELTP